MSIHRAVPALLLIAAPLISPAQTPPTTQNQPSYTFHAGSRVVLTDVTVTDGKGNPIHGLPQSAFHIFDNKQPQPIASFEEHQGTPAATPMPASVNGVYSNEYLLHLPPVLDVLVLDITNLEITDQMYLYYELNRFLKDLPDGRPLAIYLRSGDGTFLLQNFTTDRPLLLKALQRAIPRFPPHGREYLSEVDTLHEIAVYLSQIPGRKNVLWYSGGSTLFLRADPTLLENPAQWRAIYDELEQGRIAVYPVDARGLTVWTNPALNAQHSIMEEVARATGGHAFYNTNGLLEAADQLVNTGGSFYTLTYSPHDFQFDNKWHKVSIKLDGAAYNLSYRRGYFADGSLASADQPARSRTRLLAGGEKIEEPELHNAPIIFRARVLPTGDPAAAALPPPSVSVPPPAPKKGTTPFLVRYSVPVDVFTLQTIDGKPKIAFGLAAFAFNRDGRTVTRNAVKVSLSLNEESLRRNPDGSILVGQQINLEKGDEFLYLAVWDMSSSRLGTLQITLDVPKPAKHQETAAKN